MPSYKLTYFHSKGRGEIIRYIFAVAGVSYQDNRLTREEWQEIKSTTPQQQLPCLEVDGKVLPQSAAIARYLAREFGLMGSNNWEQAEVDVVMETITDMMFPIVQMFYEKDDEAKAKLLKTCTEETFPKILGDLEKILEANGNDFFVGKGLTLADICVFDGLYYALGANAAALDTYPKLLANRKMMEEHPKIAEWIAKRPVTTP